MPIEIARKMGQSILDAKEWLCAVLFIEMNGGYHSLQLGFDIFFADLTENLLRFIGAAL